MEMLARIDKHLEGACHSLWIGTSRQVSDPRFSSVDQGEEIIRGWCRKQVLARCSNIDRRSMGLNPQAPTGGWSVLRNTSSCQPTWSRDHHLFSENHLDGT